MATSGQITKAVTSYDTLIFKWWIDSQSVSGNYSNIKWQLILQSGAYGAIYSSASKSWSVTVNGTTYSGTNGIAIGNNSSKVLASGTTKVTHNADGTKTFSFSFSQQFSITFSGSSIGTITGSGSGTPTTIPRASTPTLSASSVEMEKGLTVTTNRASSSFTHILWYQINGGDWVRIAGSIGASYAWTVPLTLANSIPNGTSITVTLILETYNGSTYIGSKTKTFTATVPASVKPTISTVTVAEAVSGLSTKFEVYIQNRSKLKFTITASGASASTISEIKTVVDGQTLTGASPTSGEIKTSGTLTATITVKDSRGRTASTTKSITVLAYSKPSIQTFTAERSNASGTAQDDGTNAKITYKTAITSLNSKNDNTIKIEYRQVGATAWTELYNLTGYALDTNKITGAIFNGDNPYEIKITVSDYFYSGDNAVYAVISLPTAFVTFDVNASGKGFSIGEVSQADGFTVNMVSKFKKAVEFLASVVFKVGVKIIDASGAQLTIENGTANTNTWVTIKRTDVGRTIAFGIGASGQNEGIWSNHKDNWLMYYDGENVFVNGQKIEDTGWIVLKNANKLVVRYRRKNGIVYVQAEASGSGDGSLGANAWTTIGTLPEGFRPPIYHLFTFNTKGGSPSGMAGTIWTGGSIELYNTVGTNYWAFSTSFPASV